MRDINELNSDVGILVKERFGDQTYTSLDIIKIFLGLNTEWIPLNSFRDHHYYGKYKDSNYLWLIELVEDAYKDKISDFETRRSKN